MNNALGMTNVEFDKMLAGEFVSQDNSLVDMEIEERKRDVRIVANLMSMNYYKGHVKTYQNEYNKAVEQLNFWLEVKEYTKFFGSYNVAMNLLWI